MPSLPISNVRQNLFGLVQQVNDDHDPLTVVTKTGENAVLVAESDWNSLMETLYVLQTHGGVHLLKSAQDARDGRTQARALIDPDAETPDEVDDASTASAEAPVESDRLRALIEKLADAAAAAGAPTTELIEELRDAGVSISPSRMDQMKARPRAEGQQKPQEGARGRA
ncbi:type II toxin-antitoxin system Phd/YefM family antitoxin [Nocardia sp. NPDC051321]|uniref:type II toxin-antitoxin system Phd/YefM family antitoxin n=1 Tax=Nocardia sp. NPDC051321 TaxID=3364323 RepID=UPI003793E8B9